MAKSTGNEFNNSKFYNASFFDGNGRSRNYFQRDNALNNVQTASEQTTGKVDGVISTTLNAYELMYTDPNNGLIRQHKDYLSKILDAETSHYNKLTDINNGVIIQKYNGLYTALEQRHKEYLSKVGMPDFSESTVANPSSNNVVSVAAETTLVGIKDTLDKIQEGLKYNTGSSSAIAGTDQTAKALYSIRDNTSNMSKEDREANRNRQELAGRVVSIYSSLSSSLVQGKTNSQLLKGITGTLSSWVQGGPYAAAFTAIMEIASAVTQFFGQAISDHWSTMEESFNNYGVYVHRWNDQYAGYTKDIINKQDELYALNLEDNIKSTDWMRKQVELASRGFDADRAEDVALQDLILNKIVPNLDTSSNIFMDLQQRGMRDIVESLGGITESVRNISSSSRISQLALGTVVDKLGPVELYSKKNLLGGRAAAALAALESMNISTEDAINIVSSVSGVISHPGQALTGGSTIERLLAVALTSGEVDLENALPELISQYFGYANVFGGGIPKGQAFSPMLTDIMSGVTGIALNPYAEWDALDSDFKQFYDTYKETAQEPQSAYSDLYNTFSEGFFQTADQRLEVLANNTELAAGANGFLHQIAEWTFGIYEDVAKLADKLLGRSDADIDARRYYDSLMRDTSLSDAEKTLKLQEYLGSHTGYSDEMAKKFIGAMVTSETAKDYSGSYLETLKKYDKQAYEQALLDDVAYQTNQWKLLQSQANGTTVVGFGDRYDLAAYNSGNKPESLKSDRVQAEDWSTLGLLAKYGAAHVLLPGADLAIGAGIGLKEYYDYKSGKKVPVRESGMATGGYVSTPQLALIGEGRDPELVTPVPQLVSAVARGIDYSSRMKPDYSPLIESMSVNTQLIIQAINNISSRGSGILDKSTGLANITNSPIAAITTGSSLKPLMTMGDR